MARFWFVAKKKKQANKQKGSLTTTDLRLVFAMIFLNGIKGEMRHIASFIKEIIDNDLGAN